MGGSGPRAHENLESAASLRSSGLDAILVTLCASVPERRKLFHLARVPVLWPQHSLGQFATFLSVVLYSAALIITCLAEPSPPRPKRGPHDQDDQNADRDITRMVIRNDTPTEIDRISGKIIALNQ